MPSRSQRWGSRSFSRSSAQAPVPTEADQSALVYRLTYEHPITKTRTQFEVLAFTEEQAADFGAMRLREQGDDPDTATIAAVTRLDCVTIDGLFGSVLEVESTEEYATRQRAWIQRIPEAQRLTQKGQLGGYRSGVTKRLRTTTLVESGR